MGDVQPLLQVKDVSKSYFDQGKEFKILDLIRFEPMVLFCKSPAALR